jgi:hypothetical protein
MFQDQEVRLPTATPTAASLTPLTRIGGPTGTFQTSQHAYQRSIPFLIKWLYSGSITPVIVSTITQQQ